MNTVNANKDRYCKRKINGNYILVGNKFLK